MQRIAVVTAIIGAAIFYLWQLGRADIVTDEASHATRAIGLVDFDFGIEQPTPWQWVDNVPWWMRLSFHDHPILLFLAQHLSIRAFGETPFAARLPSALAGVASVIFVYLIGTQLYRIYGSPTSIGGKLLKSDFHSIEGVAAALLFAVTVNHVWISRIGLFESLMLAFMLAAFWAFLRGLERPKFLPLSGALLGLAFLTKYTALILLPVFATILIVQRASRTPRNEKFLYAHDRMHMRTFLRPTILALGLFLVVASPVIIYNLQLYRNFGHFDFQFSLLFGQGVEAWQARPGQEVLGSYAERTKNFISFLIQSNSPYFLILSVLGLATMLWQTIRNRWRSHGVILLALAWLLPFLIFIGPAPRFLTLLTPWLALAASYALATFSHRAIHYRGLTSIVVGVVLLTEAAYAYNSVIALDPVGSRPWAYSSLRRQAGSWGFNELNAYLDAELKGKMPDPAITFEFPFAREILNEARAEGLRRGFEPAPVGIVYNDNVNLAAQLWVFLKRITYQGWPVVSAENFRRGGAAEFLRQSGVQKIYFINATEHALQDRPRPPVPDGDIIESQLRAAGVNPKEIKDLRGKVVFRIYEFGLQ